MMIYATISNRLAARYYVRPTSRALKREGFVGGWPATGVLLKVLGIPDVDNLNQIELQIILSRTKREPGSVLQLPQGH